MSKGSKTRPEREPGAYRRNWEKVFVYKTHCYTFDDPDGQARAAGTSWHYCPDCGEKHNTNMALCDNCDNKPTPLPPLRVSDVCTCGHVAGEHEIGIMQGDCLVDECKCHGWRDRVQPTPGTLMDVFMREES